MGRAGRAKGLTTTSRALAGFRCGITDQGHTQNRSDENQLTKYHRAVQSFELHCAQKPSLVPLILGTQHGSELRIIRSKDRQSLPCRVTNPENWE